MNPEEEKLRLEQLEYYQKQMLVMTNSIKNYVTCLFWFICGPLLLGIGLFLLGSLFGIGSLGK
jgi:hypothetical protein